jgi:DNA segregation ATPase FtsK/SpoIIIE, S-DNA-T family
MLFMLKKTQKDYLKKYKKEARQEAKDGQPAPERPHLKAETKNGIAIVAMVALTIIFVLSLFGWAGTLGQWINTGLMYVFGWGRYVVPVVFLIIIYLLSKPQQYAFRLTNYIGLVFLVLSYSGLLHLIFVPLTQSMAAIKDGKGGGYIGIILSYPLDKAMGPWATGVLLFALFVISLLVLFDVSLKRLSSSGSIFKRIAERWREFFYRLRMNMEKTTTNEVVPPPEETPLEFGAKPIAGEAVTEATPPGQAQPQNSEAKQMAIFPQPAKPKKRKIDIPIDLLESSNAKPTSGDIESNKEKIYRTLKNFGIEVEMGDTKVGPTVTQYTLKPMEGVKLSQITTLNNDLALALAAHPIRIEAPIPGQSLVGIEVPNKAVAVVKLKEILMSEDFRKRKSNLTVALGKDVAGHAWVADLDPMPHLLVAGATGSGKSVCLNTILLSLLYQNSPDELKLILVDPKRVEMTVYNGIPHLLTPVVNDIDKTINALRWVVSEMDRRYELLSKTGHRNIQAYNRDNGNDMPYLVVAIDELADLMSVAANEVEAAIIRLAQMARAVGIHLILATQRPSVDIITGLIKANITTRIAFSVASAVDSRTILDTSGAEKLLGRGDMLLISPQLSKPKRIQGAFVTDEEIERVASFLKAKGQPEYQEEVTTKVIDRTLMGNFEDLGDDELVGQAKDLILKAGKASASLLQRRLRVGYARAARLLDILEEQGIIGPGDGAKPREILVARQGVSLGNAPVGDDEDPGEEIGDDDDGTEEAENEAEADEEIDSEEEEGDESV